MLGYLSTDVICSGKQIENAPNGGYCVYYPSNIFATRAVLKIRDIFRFLLGHFQSRDASRPIARERKYLMDYKE